MESHEGSALAVVEAVEGETVGAVGKLPERDYCMGIASEASSSCQAMGARRHAAVGYEGEGGWRGDPGGDGGGEAGLELGLSLRVTRVVAHGVAAGNAAGGVGARRRECCRILTAKDFPSIVASRGSPISSSSSSSASSSPGDVGGEGGGASVAVAGTKRAADSVVPEHRYRSPGQVVGWPPVRSYRLNSLMSHFKDVNSDEKNSNNGHHNKATGHSASIHNSGMTENTTGREHDRKRVVGGSLFVKVNMDGMPIGRKVDLNTHGTYETLALALEDMFQEPSLFDKPIGCSRTSKLLDGSSEFVLTYEDKDGDLLLVGDVPWGMFLSTVKRLRIMRTSEAKGLAPRREACKAGLRNNHT